jgi:hypothetical protein
MIGNYYDLTIEQFLRIKTISQLEADPLQRNIRMVAELTGKSIDEVESMPIQDLQKLIKKFSEIDALEPNAKLKMKFKIGGKRYEYIWKTQEMTSYQYIDATHFCKDPINNIHNILAAITVERDVFGRRKKYDGTTHKERSELFAEKMKIKDAMPVMLFFCKYLEALSQVTQTCLTDQVNQLKTMAEGLNKSGDGLALSTN